MKKTSLEITKFPIPPPLSYDIPKRLNSCGISRIFVHLHDQSLFIRQGINRSLQTRGVANLH